MYTPQIPSPRLYRGKNLLLTSAFYDVGLRDAGISLSEFNAFNELHKMIRIRGAYSANSYIRVPREAEPIECYFITPDPHRMARMSNNFFFLSRINAALLQISANENPFVYKFEGPIAHPVAVEIDARSIECKTRFNVLAKQTTGNDTTVLELSICIDRCETPFFGENRERIDAALQNFPSNMPR